MKVKLSIGLVIVFLFAVSLLPSFTNASTSSIHIVSAIDTGGVSFTPVVLDGANHYLYAVGWQDSDWATVPVINTITNKLISTVDLGFGGDNAWIFSARYIPVSNEVWVTGDSDWGQNIYVIQGTSLIATIPVPKSIGPYGLGNSMRFDPSNGYVYLTWTGGVTIFNGKTNTFVKTLNYEPKDSSGNYVATPLDMVSNPLNGEMYVANLASNGSSVNDFVTIIKGSTIVGKIVLPYQAQLSGCLAYDPANKGIYLAGAEHSSDGTNYVFATIINATNNKVKSTIPFSQGTWSYPYGSYSGPNSIVFDPANNQMYVAVAAVTKNETTAYVNVTAINSFTNKVSYPMLNVPNYNRIILVYDSANKNVYVTLTNTGSLHWNNVELAVISSSTNKVVAWLNFKYNYFIGMSAIYNTYDSYVYILTASSNQDNNNNTVLAVSSY